MTFLSDPSERRRANPDEVRPGESFRPRRNTPPSQTATVLELREGLCGIPHVLFKLAIECSGASRRFEEPARLLAVESFLDNYPEHVQ
ncbi:MAG TPA: hypothetical protein VKB68_22235 [Stellaceae bacterium]|nr:hypothetical protein [Stellaceae bacterium]